MRVGSTFLLWLRLMLVGIWFGLYWVLFSFFDHFCFKVQFQIQSSVQFVQFVQFVQSYFEIKLELQLELELV